jgi:hypothetical protein
VCLCASSLVDLHDIKCTNVSIDTCVCVCVCVCMCVCACVCRACVCACVRACTDYLWIRETTQGIDRRHADLRMPEKERARESERERARARERERERAGERERERARGH